MTQEVQIGNITIVLDSSILYSGLAEPNASEKLVRKTIGLPVKKKLIYYKDKRKANSAIDIKSYYLKEMYDISERWYTVEITLNDDSTVLIHSGYLAEMQKPSFVADMVAQDKRIE